MLGSSRQLAVRVRAAGVTRELWASYCLASTASSPVRPRALVDKCSRVWLAALFGLADGVAFLIGAGLGWAFLSEPRSRSSLGTSCSWASTCWWSPRASAADRKVGRVGAPVRAHARQPHVRPGQQTGSLGGEATRCCSPAACSPTSGSTRPAGSRSRSGLRRRRRASPEWRCWSGPVRSPHRLRTMLTSSPHAWRARRACGRRIRSRRGRTRRRDPRRATPYRACRHAPTVPHPRTAA